MAHKLTGKNLEYVSDNMVSCKKHLIDKRGMTVTVADESTGEQVKNRLMSAYAAKDYYKGLGWKDFTITFPTVWQRDEAVNDVNAAVIEYRDMQDDPGIEPTEPASIAQPDEEETDKPDYTTYVIIGVAAAIIIAMLLWRRK